MWKTALKLLANIWIVNGWLFRQIIVDFDVGLGEQIPNAIQVELHFRL